MWRIRNWRIEKRSWIRICKWVLELYEGFFVDGNMKKYGGFNRTTKVETYRKYVKEFDLSDDFSYYCREVFEEFKYD